MFQCVIFLSLDSFRIKIKCFFIESATCMRSIMKTPPKQIPETFSVGQAFHVFNEYFNAKIGYAIDLLESMRKDPENHKKEWAEMVTIITDKYMDKKDNFDWSDQLCPWKAE